VCGLLRFGRNLYVDACGCAHHVCTPDLVICRISRSVTSRHQTPRVIRCVTLHFTPRAIQAYSATFAAEVEAGTDPRTRAFTCELRGEGSLPSLTLQVRSGALALRCMLTPPVDR
jgi:hypothetical protein